MLICEIIASYHLILDYLLLQIRIGQPRKMPKESYPFELFPYTFLFFKVCYLLSCASLRRHKPIIRHDFRSSLLNFTEALLLWQFKLADNELIQFTFDIRFALTSQAQLFQKHGGF